MGRMMHSCSRGRRSSLFFRLLPLLLCLMLAGSGGAELAWPERTEGQRMLRDYVELVDRFLAEQGEGRINSLFEAYSTFAVFGITDQPEAEMPEGVEITARLYSDSIDTLEVRVNDASRFPRVASAFIHALTPGSITKDEALVEPTRRARQALEHPDTSFEDTVEALNGTVPYLYYAYYPNQYADGVNWIQLTIVFPMAGSWDGSSALTGATATRGPDTYSGNAEDYDGYYSEDDYTHYEVFVTNTPEPDSPAGGGFEAP